MFNHEVNRITEIQRMLEVCAFQALKSALSISDIPISAIRQDASQPTVSCKDVPKINHRNTFTATVYVRWNAKRVLNTSIAFVFDMRSRDKNGTMTDWFPSIARVSIFIYLSVWFLLSLQSESCRIQIKILIKQSLIVLTSLTNTCLHTLLYSF